MSTWIVIVFLAALSLVSAVATVYQVYLLRKARQLGLGESYTVVLLLGLGVTCAVLYASFMLMCQVTRSQ